MTEVTTSSNRLIHRFDTSTKLSAGKLTIEWLFNPFRFVAGFQALLIGLAIILISGYVGSLSNTHFDGVLDVHTGTASPMWLFLTEGVIDWICIAVTLIIFGFVVSRSSFRIIDVLGTQALARWPFLITSIVMFPDANRRVLDYIIPKVLIAALAMLPDASRKAIEYIMPKVTQAAPAAAINPADVLVFGFAMIVVLLMTIWMVVLMYRAYTVSCNIKGAKGVITFIVSIIIAEVPSKIAIILLVRAFLVSA